MRNPDIPPSDGSTGFDIPAPVNRRPGKRGAPPSAGDPPERKTPPGRKQPFPFGSLLFAVLILGTVILASLSVYRRACAGDAVWTEEETLPPGSRETQTEYAPVRPYGEGYLADLREYEEYLNPILDRRDAFLLLADREHPLGKDYVPAGLRKPGAAGVGENVLLVTYAAKALEAMALEMEAQGVLPPEGLSVTAGYVSYRDTEARYNALVDRLTGKGVLPEIAAQEADAAMRRPGADDLQTGLSFTLMCRGKTGTAFASSEIFPWLSENAWKFGFILRYPQGRETVTGASYDPSLFRYVGRYHASAMTKAGLCLEEYTAWLEE